MAAEFIGMQMLVTLRDPPATLKGTVSAVEAGAGLTLSNVWWLESRKWEPRLSIDSSNIADVKMPNVAPYPPHPTQQAPPHPPIAAQETRPPPNPAFVDPAIVAVGKRPGPGPTRIPDPHPQPNTSEKRDPGPVVIPSVSLESTSQNATPTAATHGSHRGLRMGEPPAGTLESADEDLAPDAVPAAIQGAGQRKKNRRQRKPGSGRGGTQEEAEVSPQGPKGTSRGPGWRQTPMLQSNSSFQPFNSLRGAKGRQANDNGWASEDVTDVQEAGDFDFEGGLAKFDKYNLFEQMRKDDQIDDADRLVSHNRQPKPKPGTAGGKNLHHSENVLDMPSAATLKPAKDRPTKEPANDFWNSEADDGALNGGERLSGRELGSSRQGSRRGESKVSATRRSQSRKASGAVPGQAPSRVNSGVSHFRTQSARGSRPSSRLSANAVMVDKKKQLTTSANIAANPQQGLYLLPSSRRIEPVSALQMLNLENIAHNEIGLTEDMMTENAGRGIAQVTLTALSDPAIKVRQAGMVDASSGGPPPQTVVVLAGNNKSGIRAVAAARHLRNKGINVLVCVVGFERGERDLLEDMRQQVRLYKNLGGRVFSKADFFEHIRKISIPMLTIDTPRTSLSSLANPAPVMLIIDALLGLAISFEELRNGDQATVYELIEWANRNEAFVLGVDIPTGIDPSTGKVSVIDGNRLYVKPRYVVAIGAPKRGLLEAMIAAEDDDGETVLPPAAAEAALPTDDAVLEWRLYLVDMGLGPAVWKKAGTRMRRGVDFDDRWVVEMRYQGLTVDAEDLA
ncbi:YjeF-related protein N-terminus-domain-containing protein [Apodospora peruviana]|uniref:Enhancer of mRNA-decapping protein 3 n=1 Tax=Apodospora peruviana TaxID=516989 RepID=A0AAE0M7J0_9PEZI|nr:YjeF-related protein N-terminus-domain-containing protein [Apodospora peruviana]